MNIYIFFSFSRRNSPAFTMHIPQIKGNQSRVKVTHTYIYKSPIMNSKLVKQHWSSHVTLTQSGRFTSKCFERSGMYWTKIQSKNCVKRENKSTGSHKNK